MQRRNFLKFMGMAVVAGAVAPYAVVPKGIESV